MDDVESQVKECMELEEWYKVNYASKILATEPEDSYKKTLALQLQSASNIIWNTFAESRRQWDGRNSEILSLIHGEACVILLKNLVRIMNYPCPL